MKHLTDTVTWITVQDLLSSHYNVMALWRSSLREWRVANNSRVWRFSRYEEREEALYDVSCGEACDVSEIVRGRYTLVREIRGLLLSLRNDLAYTKFEARQAADHLLDLARRPPACLSSGVPTTNKRSFQKVRYGSGGIRKTGIALTSLLLRGLPV